ncbi:iron complex transport system substrate-binding protein [Enhydrobacter aerosaccus]|uniref:Iron complex transport system substrate-binding protein n=2 Tax=Enhydrobacter aerosaccus TaxID=225324 RepID=A0A1T4JSH6_9HYPH|nr:iron complex transport system substrate-binding protein [Enhydrobacter aerosaccus]
MVGWVPLPQQDAKKFLVPSVRDLPASVRLTGKGGPSDFTSVMALQPDLIVDFGSTNSDYVNLAERVQKATGIPYALIDGRLDRLPAALRLAGDILGRTERGEALASYAADTLVAIDRAIEAVPTHRRPRVYIARGADGLQTAPRGSGLAETIERAGATNVADLGAGMGSGLMVTIQQVSAWAPDVIIAFDQAAADVLRDNAEWHPIVSSRRLIVAPTLPWNWLGEPPSVNRLIGLRWLAAAFYRVQIDLVSEIRKFHRLFYGTTPTDPELKALLQGAL